MDVGNRALEGPHMVPEGHQELLVAVTLDNTDWCSGAIHEPRVGGRGEGVVIVLQICRRAAASTTTDSFTDCSAVRHRV